MANLMWWKRPSSAFGRRHDIEHLGGAREPFWSVRSRIDRVVSRRSLFREMERMFDEFGSPSMLRTRMTRLIEEFLGARHLLSTRGLDFFVPEVEVGEREDAYILRADIPGVRREDVDIRVDDDNVLSIAGERYDGQARRERGHGYTERRYGAFSRTIALPRGIDAARIEANFVNGVLEVHVPKTEAGRGRSVPVGSRETSGRDGMRGISDGIRSASGSTS